MFQFGELIFTIFWIWCLLRVISSTRGIFRHLQQSPPFYDIPFALQPVSIIKIMPYWDDTVLENIKSFFRLDYPEYELILVVKTPHVIQRITQELLQQQARCQLHFASSKQEAFERSQHDWVLISDARIRVSPDFIKRMMGHMESSTGAVTAFITGRFASGFWAQCQAFYINTQRVRWQQHNPWALSCQNLLLRKNSLVKSGGFATLQRHLERDFINERKVKMLGLRTHLMCDPVAKPVRSLGYWQYMQWLFKQAYRQTDGSPKNYLVWASQNAILTSLLGAFSLQSVCGISWYVTAGLSLAVWIYCDQILNSYLQKKYIGFSYLSLWFLKEFNHFLALFFWIPGLTWQGEPRLSRINH